MSPKITIALLVLLALCAPATFGHPGGVDADGCHREPQKQARHCHASAQSADLSQAPAPGDEGVFYGPLVRIIDGDSLEARVQGVVMEFRLSDIDAPEHGQPYGEEAKRELARLVRGRQLVLRPFDVDSYGRTVVHVWVDDVHVNREMVVRGAAWFLPRYARDATLYEVEQAARAAQRGLWAAPLEQRLEPWEWRRRKREGQESAATLPTD